MIAMHFPKVGCAMAFGLPIDEAVERVLACARELNTAAEKIPEGEGYAQRLTKAVQARVGSAIRPRIGVLAKAAVAPKAEDETFAEKLCKAVKAKVGSRSCPVGRKTEAANDDETFADKLSRITKARAKGIRVGMS